MVLYSQVIKESLKSWLDNNSDESGKLFLYPKFTWIFVCVFLRYGSSIRISFG